MIRTSRIPAGVIVEGQIRGQGDLVIAGLVEGSLDIDGLVVIESTGQVRGPIRARAISVSGSVQGPLTADDTVRLEPGARVIGDVVASNVSAALGAMVRGRVRMAGAERLDRTEGGTVRAPWSSAGTLVAARTATGMIAAPKIERPLAPPSEPVRTEDKPKRLRTATAAPPILAERVGERHAPAPVPAITAPLQAPMPVAEPVRHAPVTATSVAAMPVAAMAVAEPVRRGPPPPVMPSVGRVRARRKDGADRDVR